MENFECLVRKKMRKNFHFQKEKMFFIFMTDQKIIKVSFFCFTTVLFTEYATRSEFLICHYVRKPRNFDKNPEFRKKPGIPKNPGISKNNPEFRFLNLGVDIVSPCTPPLQCCDSSGSSMVARAAPQH